MEGSRDNRGGVMPRPYTYVNKNSAEVQRGDIYGIPEREEHADDI